MIFFIKGKRQRVFVLEVIHYVSLNLSFSLSKLVYFSLNRSCFVSISAASGLHLRLCPVFVAFSDGPEQDRNLGNVLEVREDRGEAQSLGGIGLHGDGLPHVVHQLKSFT